MVVSILCLKHASSICLQLKKLKCQQMPSASVVWNKFKTFVRDIWICQNTDKVELSMLSTDADLSQFAKISSANLAKELASRVISAKSWQTGRSLWTAICKIEPLDPIGGAFENHKVVTIARCCWKACVQGRRTYWWSRQVGKTSVWPDIIEWSLVSPGER